MATRPMTVLILEPHEDTARSLSILLAEEGYRVLIARDVAEARRLGKSERPDVAVMETGSPGAGGFAAGTLLREIWGDDVYLVSSSVFDTDDSRYLATEAGFNQILPKPCDPHELLAMLRSRAEAVPV